MLTYIVCECGLVFFYFFLHFKFWFEDKFNLILKNIQNLCQTMC